MTNESVAAFVFEGDSPVRLIERDADPWFVAADVCRALGIANAAKTVEGLDDDEKGMCSVHTPGGQQEMLIVSESGVFTLILLCRDFVEKGTLPHRFRRWIAGEVLPAFRKRGALSSLPVADTPPEALKVRLVAEARQTFGQRAAAELWRELSLPTVPAMFHPPGQGSLF